MRFPNGIARRVTFGLSALAILILAACSTPRDAAVTPVTGNPQVDVYLVVGSERTKLSESVTAVAGPESTFEVIVRDPGTGGITSSSYRFNDTGPWHNFRLNDRGAQMIQSPAPLTGSTGSLSVRVQNSLGRATQVTYTFNLDSVAPEIHSLVLNGVDYVGQDVPDLQLFANGVGGATLQVDAEDVGTFASDARVVFAVNERVVASGTGSLDVLVTSANLEIGRHAAQVYAADEAGNISRIYRFAIAVVEPDGLVPPTVTISWPAENAVIPAGADFQVVVDTIRGSADVTSLNVRLGTISLTQLDGRTFSGTAPLAAGTYLLEAEAMAADGEITTAGQSIEVSATAPSVSIVAPINQQEYRPGSEVRVILDVADQGGGVGDIGVLLNGMAPSRVDGHTFHFTAPTVEDQYEIVATAHNYSGTLQTTVDTIIRVAANPAPTVEIRSPVDPHTVGPNELVTVDLFITDNGGGIDNSSVTVTLGGVEMLTTDNRRFTLNAPAPLPGETDRFEIHAWASNADGSRVSPLQVQDLFVDAMPPTVQIVDPLYGDALESPDGITVAVVASDHRSEIEYVSLEVNRSGGWSTYRIVREPETVIQWNPPPGGWLLRATSQDEHGNVGVSRMIPVFVSPTLQDDIRPGISLLSPASTEVISASSGDEISFVIGHFDHNELDPRYSNEFRVWFGVRELVGSQALVPSYQGGNAHFTFTIPPETDAGDYVLWVWHTTRPPAGVEATRSFVPIVISVE